MAELFQAIQAGGNVALMAIAVAIYKLDRRMLAVEITLKSHMERDHAEAR